jgi:hypothetical protein
MHRPRLFRNNSFSQEVAWEASEDETDSLFAAKNRLLQQLRPRLRETFVHREDFVVEYGESPPALSPVEEALWADRESPLKQINRYLRQKGLATQLALQRQRDFGRRVKKQLGGDDAACFVYCDTMNKQFL